MGMQLPVLVRLRNRISARRRVLTAAAEAFGGVQLLPQRVLYPKYTYTFHSTIASRGGVLLRCPEEQYLLPTHHVLHPYVNLLSSRSGYICVSLPGARLEELAIPMMVPQNEDRHRTAYTVTVDYKHGTTTGISAHDRALTVRALAAASPSPSPSSYPSPHPHPLVTAASFARPGHMVPLRARAGGVLARRGHTESALDLCALAGLPRAGVLCELVEDDDEGSMMRRDGCRRFADRWGLKMISVEMLVRWREEHELKEKAQAQS